MWGSQSGDYEEYYLEECEALQKLTGISEERTASIFRVKEAAKATVCSLLAFGLMLTFPTL
jgi:hypothetical protein